MTTQQKNQQQQQQTRLLPHDLEAEEAVLGSVLIAPECLAELVGKLQPEDFYREANRLVWQAMQQLFRAGVDADQVTVAQRLKADGNLECARGMAYLSHLVSITPTSVHAGYYADIVAEYARRRRLVSIARDLYGMATDGGSSAEAVEKSVLDLLSLRTGQAESRPESMREINDRCQAQFMEKLEADADYTTGTPTGFTDLDRITNGFQPGLTYIMGARTSVGKTMMCNAFALKLALRGQPVFFSSLELPKAELAERMVFALARVDRNGYKFTPLGTPEREELNQRLRDAFSQVDGLPVTIDDRKALRVVDIRAALLGYCQVHGPPALFIVDYLNLVRPDNGRQSLYERTTEIVTTLRDLAGEFHVPLLLAAQLNRGPEQRPDQARRPTMADFRDSGAIEQVASCLLGLYRDSLYYTEEEWERAYPGERYPEHLMEVLVLKQQGGPTGRVKLYCEMDTGFVGNGDFQ